MAKAAAGKGILVKVHGQYYFKTDTQKGVKSFTKEVRFPSLEIFRETTRKQIGTEINKETRLAEPVYETRSFINIRGLLKRRFMPVLLAKEFPDFARVRFVSVDEVVSLDGAALSLPLSIQSRKQLAAFVEEKAIPLDVDTYLDIDELRNDISEYLESPESFLRSKSKKDRLRIEEREFMEMNGLSETLAPRKDRVIVAKEPSAPSIADL